MRWCGFLWGFCAPPAMMTDDSLCTAMDKHRPGVGAELIAECTADDCNSVSISFPPRFSGPCRRCRSTAHASNRAASEASTAAQDGEAARVVCGGEAHSSSAHHALGDVAGKAVRAVGAIARVLAEASGAALALGGGAGAARAHRDTEAGVDDGAEFGVGRLRAWTHRKRVESDQHPNLKYMTGKERPRAGRGGARGPRTGFDGEDGAAAVHAARAIDLSAVGVCAPAGAGGGVALHGHEVALLVALRDEGARHDAGRGELRSARAAARSGVGAWRPKQPTRVSKETALAPDEGRIWGLKHRAAFAVLCLQNPRVGFGTGSGVKPSATQQFHTK